MTNDLTAIETFCCTQWHDLHAFVQRRGYDCHQAEDLTQEFFARLFGRKFHLDLNRTAQQCRAYMIKALQNFLANEWHREHCQKRGGGGIPLPLDDLAAERYADELVESRIPEAQCDQQWASALLERALGRLRREYTDAGNAELFERLRVCLPGAESEWDYARLAAASGASAPATRMAVHRLRRRYGELVRAEIAGTVSDREDVDEEIRSLIAAASRG
jgi:hypothetical protein